MKGQNFGFLLTALMGVLVWFFYFSKGLQMNILTMHIIYS